MEERIMYEEKGVQILTKIGFTASQAKIYLTILKQGEPTASRVAKTSQTDRAETYRLIAQLEEKGFVERIITHPFKFKAIPIERLLPTLIRNKKMEIAQIEKKAIELIQNHLNAKSQVEQEEEYISFVPRAEIIMGDIHQGIHSAERSIDVLTPIKVQRELGRLERKYFEDALRNGVTITVILEKPCKENSIPTYDKELKQYPNFILRCIPSSSKVLFVIGDDKKVWIKMSNASYYKNSWLFSNNQHIVALVRDYFDKILKDSTPCS
jgi:sugar-specific transcriptional regulator TrmB